MAKEPVRKNAFNPNFVMPVIDLILVGALLVSAGMIWYNTRGIEQMLRSKERLAQARVEMQAREDSLLNELDRAREYNEELGRQRQAYGEEIVGLGEQIQSEQMELQNLARIDQTLTNTILDMNERIRAADEQRRSYQSTLLDRDLEIQTITEEVSELKSDLADTVQRREAIEQDIAELRQERAHDPISIFPVRASLSSGVELADQENFYTVSLAGVLGKMGDVEMGVAGGVGLAGNSDGTVKEGTFFANIPLAFRRASLDLTGGVASVTDPTVEDDLGATAGATLRYAPLRRERFFLEAGTRYRQEDVSVRLGLGFGRR